MSDREKCELLKSSIYQLYSKEGRSKNYISKLFEISRYTLADKIKEWDFPEPAFKRTILPSTEKFLNKNRNFILAELKKGSTIVDIAKKLKVDRKKIYSLFKYDDELCKSCKDKIDINNFYKKEIKNKKAFDKILYKDKYEFKTVAAFSRFLGKSETQTRRYLDEPEKHETKLINKTNNCND